MINLNDNHTIEDYDKWLSLYYAKLERNNTRILNAIKSLKGQKYLSEILIMLKDSQADILSITNHTTGTLQNEEYEYPMIKECWVDQYVNGGYTGDTYEGYCYVQIKPDKYLRYHYAM